MWSKQRPTREGYYWLKWSESNYASPVSIFERMEDGKMVMTQFGDSTWYDISESKFDRAMWKPLMYINGVMPED